MSAQWCRTCSTQHGPRAACPGELTATGPELVGWRVNVETDEGIEAFAVLLAPCDGVWRARIMTYPNVLWLAPDGVSSMKFAARTPDVVERQAAAFIRAHCDERGWTLRPITSTGTAHRGIERRRAAGSVAPRKFRFRDIRFGVVHPSEVAGIGNLSETGMFIITDTPLDRGTRLRMSLPFDNDNLQLSGRVVWNRTKHRAGRSPGMGIQLNAPPDDYVAYVRGLD